MKNVIISCVFCWYTYIATAQIVTTYFEERDAFKSMPALRQTKQQNLPEKRMPQVDVEKLLNEDQLTEGIDVPFRFGQGFEVNYTLKDGTWEEQ